MVQEAALPCSTVREALAERALSALPPDEAAEIDRHLEWCAGCRKEAGELQHAAATFGMALPPATPPPHLRERVVGAVKAMAGEPGTRRRTRSAVASVIAAMVAIAGLGWGSMMTGRADREQHKAEEAQQIASKQAESITRFKRVIETLPGVSPNDVVLLGQLTHPSAKAAGGGWAMLLASPHILDIAGVDVEGLSGAGVPYRVALVNDRGSEVAVGKIKRLDQAGGAELFNQFTEDMSGFTSFVIRDASGATVLSGRVDQNWSQGPA